MQLIFPKDSADEVCFKLSAVKSGTITRKFILLSLSNSNFLQLGNSSSLGVFLWVTSVFHYFSFFGLLGVKKWELFWSSEAKLSESLDWEILRQIVEFQWFLMALSVLPGKYLEMWAHLFPSLHSRGYTFDGIQWWAYPLPPSICVF